MDSTRLVSSSRFCWNLDCPDYGRVDAGTIRRFGKTRKGVQRYQCKRCGATFTETKGTPFYGCHTPTETILECLALLAERNRLAAIRRVKGVKEDTLIDWLRKASDHVQPIEAALMAHHQVRRAQLDALWIYVGHKGEKGGTRKKPTLAVSGAAR